MIKPSPIKPPVIFVLGLLVAIAVWQLMRTYFGEVLTVTTQTGDILLIVAIFTLGFFARRFLSA